MSLHKAPFNTQPALSRLREIYIKVPFDEGFGSHLSKLASFFHLQSIRKFKGSMVTDTVSNDPKSPGFSNLIPWGTSNTEYIEMVDTHGGKGFIEVVHLCKNLKLFRYV
jgi:hypothetical protein